MSQPFFHVILVAAGSSSRMMADLPKPYMDLAGKPVLKHSIDLFSSIDMCKSITIAINPDHQSLFDDLIHSEKVTTVHGGKTRQESVYRALKSLSCADDDIILIHDAARPLVNEIDIKTLCLALTEEKTASLASPVRDTLRYRDGAGYASDSVDREDLWAIETPQGFHYGLLLEAHEKFGSKKEYTDDTNITSELGIRTKLIPSTSPNLKITYPHDFILVESLLLSDKEK
ncbi:MAG: 2-C-methyl-D-erythritol 4-phosphate cytidylyltransferase [Alphaproteobacteria bacterium]|nr:2-C-methyl-D-erythritol 4-phosphate cytidylyltransferase [Alphaproteobacteria bacterium]